MVRNFLQEFKQFALKGNMIDLAVGVVIGVAFGKVVDSIVRNVIMPIIGYVTPNTDFSQWHLGKIMIGNFINDVLSFLIIAFAVFIVVVKIVGSLTKRVAPAPTAFEPVTRECPLCLSIIPIKARKCGHCTADLAAS